MRIVYLDCGMGAAGDMLAAALYELLEEGQRASFIRQMNEAGIPGVKVSAEKTSKCGITGTHMKVTVDGIEEDMQSHEHAHSYMHKEEHPGHDHQHGDQEHHHHSGMEDIHHLIESLPFSQTVKGNATQVYQEIAEAESHVHGLPVPQIHFHEVGTMDAVADVTAVCLLMEMLGPDRVISSPVHVGSGHVHCAHGTLPVPAPATAWILRDIPSYGGEIQGELCTPTGAALLKHFVTCFGNMPLMKTGRIGYGCGKKDFAAANCIRAMLGETKEEKDKDQVLELACNIDDMTPERIGFAMERLFDAGALDVYTIPIGMKKSRPGTMLCVLCSLEDKEKILTAIFRHTTTIGIRESLCKRYILDRRSETCDTAFGPVRVKYAEGYGVSREKAEYEDLARIAREKGLSIDQVEDQMKEQYKHEKDDGC